MISTEPAGPYLAGFKRIEKLESIKYLEGRRQGLHMNIGGADSSNEESDVEHLVYLEDALFEFESIDGHVSTRQFKADLASVKDELKMRGINPKGVFEYSILVVEEDSEHYWVLVVDRYRAPYGFS